MKTQPHFTVAMVHIARVPSRFFPKGASRWAALLALAAVAFGPQPAQAAVTEGWVHRFSNIVSNSVDRPSKVVRDSLGDIIVTGTSNDNASGPDLLTIKYSGVDGSVLWQQRQRYDTSTDDSNHPRTVAAAVAVDGTDNVVVTGSTADSDNNGASDYYTAKYAAADGALLWEKRYHLPADDRANAIAVDGRDNVVVTGASATLKYASADGALLWARRSGANISPTELAVDGNGNVVVTGSSYNGTNSDFYTAKHAAVDGALLWEHRFNGPANSEDTAIAVAVDGRGNVLVTGASADMDGDSDFYTAKYAAADGALLWEKRYDGPANASDNPTALAVDGDANVVVTGSSLTTQYSYDYYTAKYAAADGALLWEKRYDGPAANGSRDFAQAVALDASGNVVVTGSSWPDYYTVKYSAVHGTPLWDRQFRSYAVFAPSLGFTDAAAVVVDGAGDVIVTGPAFSNEGDLSPGKSDYYTAKYSGEDGTPLWQQCYNGPARHASYPHSVVIDRSGDVIVTATSESDFYAAKYAASSGFLLWEKRGPGSLVQVTTDDRGNVVVTGNITGDTSGPDYYTAMYSAGGRMLWEKRYNGPADREDSATAVVSDAIGNVLVTGSSAGTSGSIDYYTAKYAVADGALLWERRYNGPGNGYDQARAVAVDGNGDFVVTGSSADSASISGSHDYYTAKYSGADGALLWEKRYTGSANGDAPGRAVAVDVSGDVVVMGLTAIVKYAKADGTLLWVKRCADTLAFALDGGGNVLVTGGSGTFKCAAADGALLWAKRFIGGGSAVAVDVSGNVLVTGNSYNNRTDADYYTIKYAAVDGTLLWEKRYNSPENGHDSLGAWHCLALGPNGMVAITGSSSLGAPTASDVVTVVYREVLPPISIKLVPIGVRLQFTGIRGVRYELERAAVVDGPWNIINTQIAPASGLIEYLDDTNPPVATAFYRTSAR